MRERGISAYNEWDDYWMEMVNSTRADKVCVWCHHSTCAIIIIITIMSNEECRRESSSLACVSASSSCMSEVGASSAADNTAECGVNAAAATDDDGVLHPLQSAWTLWFYQAPSRPGAADNNWETNLREVGTFDTVFHSCIYESVFGEHTNSMLCFFVSYRWKVFGRIIVIRCGQALSIIVPTIIYSKLVFVPCGRI